MLPTVSSTESASHDEPHCRRQRLRQTALLVREVERKGAARVEHVPGIEVTFERAQHFELVLAKLPLEPED
jgi:hypothetical protein